MGITRAFPKFSVIWVVMFFMVYYMPKTDGRPSHCKPIPPVWRYIHVISKIEMRFATTHVLFTIRNIENMTQNVSLKQFLPKNAYVTGLIMDVNGHPFAGTVKEKKQAAKQYKDAVKAGKPAVLVEAETERADTINEINLELSLAAHTLVRCNITYQELLTRTGRRYKHVFHIPSPILHGSGWSSEIKHNVQKIRADVIISDVVPQFRVHVVKGNFKGLSEESNIALLQNKSMNNKFKWFSEPSFDGRSITHLMLNDAEPNSYAVLYDLDRHGHSELLTAGGHFIHFISADDFHYGNRHIVFVLDISSSMNNYESTLPTAQPKILQLKKAMKKMIMSGLKESDKFNIVVFNAGISKLFSKTSLVKATYMNKNTAYDYVVNLRPRGSTNIDAAFGEGLSLLSSATSDRFYSMLFFLTDGQATWGETNNRRIINNIDNGYNKKKDHYIFTVGFGKDAEMGLLQTVAKQNKGMARHIMEIDSAADQLEGYFEEVSQVVMRNLKVTYTNNAVDVNTIAINSFSTKKEIRRGEELIFTGKLKQVSGQFAADITAKQLSGPFSLQTKNKQLQWNFTIRCETEHDQVKYLAGVTCEHLARITGYKAAANVQNGTWFGVNTASGFFERMYAYQRVKELINSTRKKDAKEALNLALQYQFVTPLTSMVVVGEVIKGISIKYPSDAWYVSENFECWGAIEDDCVPPRLYNAPSPVPKWLERQFRNNPYFQCLIGSAWTPQKDMSRSAQSFRTKIINVLNCVHNTTQEQNSMSKKSKNRSVKNLFIGWMMVEFLKKLKNATESEREKLPWSDLWKFGPVFGSTFVKECTALEDMKDICWKHVTKSGAVDLCWDDIKSVSSLSTIPNQIVQLIDTQILSSLPVTKLKQIPLEYLKTLRPEKYQDFTLGELHEISPLLLQHALNVSGLA